MKEKWLLKNKKTEFQKLQKECNEGLLTLRLLSNRGIDNKKAASLFLYGDIKEMHDPFAMKDLEKAVNILKDAIDTGKRIVIYGDYDCDGVCSTAVLYKGLKKLNANFKYHIPNRESEGYGMNKDRIKILKEEGAEIILTCDNGISAFEEVKLAKDLGMKVILTDHHDIPIVEEDGVKVKKMPEADVVINPKREDCTYPFKGLCGAGVSFKVLQGLYRVYGIEEEVFELLEYVSIATVCDVVDLLDENRIIVKEGLKLIRNTNKIGIKELIKVKELEGKEIAEYHFGFVIGPCINATGRLEIADISVELLITEDENRAKELAEKLNELNKIRQELTLESVEKVTEKVQKEIKNNDKVIVVYEDTIHESIAGIVAGRIKEKYNLPTIVLTKGKEMPKGSARSIEEYNMFEELSECKDLMEKFGGHPMAAGLSIKEENINKLREKLNKIAKLTEDDITPKVHIDTTLALEDLNYELLDEINRMKPFGKANPSPCFGGKKVHVTNVFFMGAEKKYLRFKIAMKNGKTIDGVNFTKYEDFKEMFENTFGEEEFLRLQYNGGRCNFYMDIIYYPDINEFRNIKNIQLNIKSFRVSE
ncbi:single-stranded-DNA-specific exonuclease RecJ [uncultured Clostridium sp.]|uniref:single-stranded-DNA-specific exonuclease RecJ n=1 Tax=uncultured Clostridium sp. TaxID=59620 RepID=UPI00262EBBEB|nr:single-stranded-DNA-specific exonuclease RecJ [uncultured Clostridium sp.]